MANELRKPEPLKMTGSLAYNLHEGSRSEYLAQFVFSSFGTSVPVPHQEDTGIDLHCTILERDGQRAWPREHYTVQVKSTMEPWVFGSPESVRWIIEHPLPIFLCIVQKADARLLVYHTTPRFAAWVGPIRHERLELIPGVETSARTVNWQGGETYELQAPILNFTVQQILDPGFRDQAVSVLKYWTAHDTENLVRIKCGIPRFRVPYQYETNSTENSRGWIEQGARFSDQALSLAHLRLKEILGLVASNCRHKADMVSAAIYALALRQMSPAGYETWNPHDMQLHAELNRLFGMDPPTYAYQACDSLVNMVKDELARHGIVEAAEKPQEVE